MNDGDESKRHKRASLVSQCLVIISKCCHASILAQLTLRQNQQPGGSVISFIVSTCDPLGCFKARLWTPAAQVVATHQRALTATPTLECYGLPKIANSPTEHAIAHQFTNSLLTVGLCAFVTCWARERKTVELTVACYPRFGRDHSVGLTRHKIYTIIRDSNEIICSLNLRWNLELCSTSLKQSSVSSFLVGLPSCICCPIGRL